MTAVDLVRAFRLAAGFKGPICVLSGFLDATACPDEPKYAGVAAYLFDESGLAAFEGGLTKIKATFAAKGLPFDNFHASKCCGNRGYAHFKNWDDQSRADLSREMALLTASTRTAGFVAFAQTADFENIRGRDGRIADLMGGGIYPAVLYYCIDMIAAFAKKKNERVWFWIEKGDDKQRNAEVGLQRIRDNKQLKERFSFENYNIIPKDHLAAAPIMSADHLAWECKKIFWELLRLANDGVPHDGSTLSENFKILRGKEQSKWFEVHLGPGALEVRALVSRFYNLMTP